MNHLSRGFLAFAGSVLFFAGSFFPASTLAQTSSKTDQWIHVRVDSKDAKGETVRVNVPIEMAEKVLPAIRHDNLQSGKIRIDNAHLNDVDLRTLLDAVRSFKDGEYVTVQSNEDNVRIAKNAGYLYIHVTEKKSGEKQAKHSEGKEGAVKSASTEESRVEIKVPMKVVDALFSAGKDELDIVAALHALSSHGDTELVSVKDDENTVRIWIDSRNISD
ncbi:MAG TPA: hypothetical protein VJX72_14170 [Candidatus Acidoferrum sp.]|nr:hypothetical protein [Candidatus Acidoferrum sp.]